MERKRVRRALAGLAVAILGAVGALVCVTADPASAAITPVRAWFACPAGQSQLSLGANGTGTTTCVVYSQHLPGSCTNLSGSWNDAVSSVQTNFGSGYGIRLWLNANCTGDGWPGPSEREDYKTIPSLVTTNLSDDARECNGNLPCGNWDNIASSYQIVYAP